MKAQHEKSLYTNRTKAITPTPKPPAREGFDILEQQATLAILEGRLNGQQKRIHDQQRHADVLHREHKALHKQVKDLQAIYVAMLVQGFKPSHNDKPKVGKK